MKTVSRRIKKGEKILWGGEQAVSISWGTKNRREEKEGGTFWGRPKTLISHPRRRW